MDIGLLDVNLALDKALYYNNLRITRLQYVQKAEQTQVSAYNGLQSLFQNFQTQLNALGTTFNTASSTASVTDPTIANASVTNGGLAVGQHNLIVTHLAQANVQASDADITTRTGDPGITGTLVLTNNANSASNFSITISAGETLEQIRDAINNSTSNIGVTASIVNTTDNSGNPKYVLALTAQTGTANAFTISGTAAAGLNFTTKQSAVDADITIDGFHVVRSSNTISDAIDGLSLTLNALGTTTINVASNASTNNSTIKTAFQKMLTAYNQVISYLDANQFITIYDDKNQGNTASVNNNTFQFIKAQLQGAVNSVVSGAGNLYSLTDLGIIYSPAQQLTDQFDSQKTVNSFGSFQIDTTVQASMNNETTLDYLLGNNFANVQSFIQGANGFIANVNNILNNSILNQSSNGMIAGAIQTINQEISDTTDKISNEVTKMNDLRNTLILQYATINANLQRMQNESDYLSKQYDYLGSLIKNK